MSILHIENYQSHADTSLEIKEGGITVVVGESRSGKSAVFRALETLALNKTVERRDGTKRTSVEWKGVERVRTNSDNMYVIDGVEYKAMRTSVPLPVQGRLRLGEINFRTQHSPHFLLNDSPGAVARKMNELTELGVMDFVMAELKSKARVEKEVLEKVTADLDTAEQRLKSLEWCERAGVSLTEYDKLVELLKDEAVEIDELSSILISLGRCEDEIGRIPDTVLPLNRISSTEQTLNTTELEELTEMLRRYEEVDLALINKNIARFCSDLKKTLTTLNNINVDEFTEQLKKLSEYIEDISECPDINKAIDRLEVVVSSSVAQFDADAELENYQEIVDIPDPERSIEGLEEVLIKLKQKGGEISESERALENAEYIETITQTIEELDEEYEITEERFRNILKEAGNCPLCGADTHENHKHS